MKNFAFGPRLLKLSSRPWMWACILIGVAGQCGCYAQQYRGIPPQPASKFIAGVTWGAHRFHAASGDTWPLTWARDGNLYGSAGDNQGSPMNFWQVVDNPHYSYSNVFPPYQSVFLVNNLPVDCNLYCSVRRRRPNRPPRCQAKLTPPRARTAVGPDRRRPGRVARVANQRPSGRLK